MMRVSQSALNRWRRQFLAEQQGISPTAPAISAEQREIQRLRAENEQFHSDNALFKRCPFSCSRSLKVPCGGFTVRRHFPRPTSRCFSLNRTTSYRWGKSPTNQIEAKVWRKQAVDFAENIANEQCAMVPNTLWAGDITYIPTKEGWLYLAVVIDWFSRLIVGWSVSDTPDSRLCIQAFRNILTEAKKVHSQSRVQTMGHRAIFSEFKERKIKRILI